MDPRRMLLLCDFGAIELRILTATQSHLQHADIITIDSLMEMNTPTGRSSRMPEMQGMRPAFWILDEVRDPIGEYLVEQTGLLDRFADKVMQIQCKEDVCVRPLGPRRPYLENQRSRYNKRDRWK